MHTSSNIIISSLSAAHIYNLNSVSSSDYLYSSPDDHHESPANDPDANNSEIQFPAIKELKQRIRKIDFESNLAAEFEPDINNNEQEESKDLNMIEFDQLLTQDGEEVRDLNDVNLQYNSNKKKNSNGDTIKLRYKLKSYPVLNDIIILSIIKFLSHKEILTNSNKKWMKWLIHLFLIIVFTLFLAACAQISFNLPQSWSNIVVDGARKTLVPISFQTFGVFIIACVLGYKGAMAATTLYAILIVVGAPFAALQNGGYEVLEGGTGGFIIGFIPASGFVGYLASRGWDRNYFYTFLCMCLGNIIIYIFGLIWLPFGVSFTQGESVNNLFCGYNRGCVGNVLFAGLVPFLPGDAIKIGLAMLLLPTIWKISNAIYRKINNLSHVTKIYFY